MKHVKASFNFCLALSFFILISCSSNDSETRFASAEKYFQEGSLNAALIEVKNVLSMDARNSDARVLMGRIYLAQGSPALAVEQFIKAIDYGHEYADICGDLAKARLQSFQLKDLLAMTVDDLPDPVVAEVRASKILGYIQSDNLTLARFELNGINDDSDKYVKVAKIKLMMAEDNIEQAQSDLERLLAIYPSYSLALELKGDVASVNQNYTAAEEAYSEAMKNNPNDYTNYLKRAITRIKLNDIEGATKDVESIDVNRYQSPMLFYVHGIISFAKRDLDDSLEKFSTISPMFSTYPEAMLYLGKIHYAKQNLQQSKQYLEKYLRVNRHSRDAIGLLASINLTQNELEEAKKYLEMRKSEGFPEDTEFLGLLSQYYLKTQNYDQAVEVLESIVGENPESVSAKLGLAMGYLSSGDSEKSISELRDIVLSDPDSIVANKVLALALMSLGEIESAYAVAKVFKTRNTDSFEAFNLMGVVDLYAKNYESAKSNFEKSHELNAADSFSAYKLAEMAVNQGDMDKAKEYYRTVVDYNKNDFKAYVNLAKLEYRDGKEESYVKNLNKAIDANPNEISPRILLSDYYFNKREFEKIDNVFFGMHEDLKRDQSYLKAMALVKNEQGEYKVAISYLEDILESYGESASVYFNLAKNYGAVGNNKNLKYYLQKSLQQDNEFYPSRIVLARLMIKDRNYEAVGDIINGLLKDAPKSPEVLELAVTYKSKVGENQAALGYAKERLTLVNDSTSSILMASSLWNVGEKSKAVELLEKWSKNNSEDIAAIEQLSRFYLAEGNYRKLAEKYKELVRLNPSNVAILNNAAWILKDFEPKEAVRYAETAISLSPNSANIMDTLAMSYWKSGDIEKAKSLIQEAMKISPDSKTISYHGAVIMEASGDDKAAVSILSSLVSGNLEFPEGKDAEKLYEELTVN